MVNRKGKNKIQMKKKLDSLKIRKEMKLDLTLNDRFKMTVDKWQTGKDRYKAID